MTLAEAIRLGAMNRPQGYGTYYNVGKDSTCALGAALDAIGELTSDGVGSQILHQRFPVLSQPFQRGCPFPDVFTAIYRLNDHHRWTRECIADWVEALEAVGPVEALDEATSLAR